MRYGTRAFELMQTVFTGSTCLHYKEDFTVHDRQMLEATAVPGLSYLWFIKPTGTHLFVLELGGHESQVNYLIKAHDPATTSWHKLSVGHGQPRLQRLNGDQAILAAGCAPHLTWVTRRGPTTSSATTLLGFGHSRIAAAAGQLPAGTAEVSVESIPGSANRRVNAAIVLRDGLSSCEKMLVKLQCELACNTLVGSLFWTCGEWTVNGAPMAQWLGDITRDPGALTHDALPRAA